MSKIQNLLGDITIGNVELMNRIMTDEITELEYENVISLWDRYGEVIYDYWMENYGRMLAIKWVIDHDEIANEEWVSAYRSYLVDKFMEWFKSNGNV